MESCKNHPFYYKPYKVKGSKVKALCVKVDRAGNGGYCFKIIMRFVLIERFNSKQKTGTPDTRLSMDLRIKGLFFRAIWCS